ncbi:nose resistant to fluoxetine protein 6-like [Anoplophora glabripennis]|uniref:nose resistant to fluoxetine protein 6-like n=1 Tax=Anoplophora glabripennis TaxID=217634 RepID=UPI000C78CBFE|nr:nose resistant to fluoxetine protein 6-like [Anoplophora glabripennis]
MGFAMVHIRHNSTLQRHTQLPLEWTIQLGLCVPHSCTDNDILALAEKYFNGDYFEEKYIYNISMQVVEVKKLIDNNLWLLELPKTIAFSVILATIFFLAIGGTIYDVKRYNLNKRILTGYNVACNGKSTSLTTVELVPKSSMDELPRQSSLGEILQCFSIYSNIKNLVKTKLSTDTVGCIHGLRFLSMLWVVAVHSLFYQADYIKNVPFVYRLSEDFMAQILSNSSYCVDSYLFLSGFLVAYLYFKSKNPYEQPNKPISYLVKIREYIMMWINRYCRLTPPYMMILIFTNIVYTFYRETSSLTSSERADIACDKYWWRNLLYINNLYPRKEMCMSWSWYLSLDTQLFTVTTLLLILSTVVFKLSAAAVVSLILTTIIATAWKCYSIGYIPTMDEQLVQMDAIYDLPWNRMGPYLIGVVTAYILKVKLDNKLTLTKKMRISLWTIFSALNIWILFTLYTRQLSVEFSAMYMGVSRTLWGVGLAWILIACCTGNARALDKLLSFRGFIPLSRITYCAYLLNPVMANMIYQSAESAFEASLAELTFTILGITLISFYAAFLSFVMLESPFILLTKIVLRKMSTRKPQPEPKPQTDDNDKAI